MALSLHMTTIVVDDYDRAISHYVGDLGFTLIEDTQLLPEKRWVVVAPGERGGKILLAKASGDSQQAAIGNSTGGRVAFFLFTDNFDKTYESYLSRNIEFIESPRNESFGKVVVFKDIYGNKWDLIESKDV
jgi:catechol 2,3-dioxygenase-like lactoylglutathione lyase family enzyme